VVPGQQVPPGAVAEPRSELGRAEGGEQHRGEHAVGLGTAADAGQELLDLVQDRRRVTRPHHVIGAWQLDEPGAGDPIRDVPPLVDIDAGVVRSIDQDGRTPDRRRDLADVDLGVHAQRGCGRLRAGGLTKISTDPALEDLVVRFARRERPIQVERSPSAFGVLDLALPIGDGGGPRMVLGRYPLRIAPDEDETTRVAPGTPGSRARPTYARCSTPRRGRTRGRTARRRPPDTRC
jgi:hypothetical protein